MEDLETLNASSSFELCETLTRFPVKTTQALPYCPSSSEKLKLFNIISTNLSGFSSTLPTAPGRSIRTDYVLLKKDYLLSELKKEKLREKIVTFLREKVDCRLCERLQQKSLSTKLALQESLKLSQLLIQEVRRLQH